MSQNNQVKADYGKIGGQFIPIVSPLLRFAGDVFRSKEEKEAIKYQDSIDARTKGAEQRVKDQGTFFDEEYSGPYYNKGGRFKKTKKKSGGRLNDGTAFIKSLYKDKL